METEPGQEELLIQKSSHDEVLSSCEASHEFIVDGSYQKIRKRLSSPISTDTSYEFIGDLTQANGEALFVDGSRYQGTWDTLGMAGVGSYQMPHDVIYEGQIRDGMIHGNGVLLYPGKQAIDGVWNRGELKKWKYTFSDGLIFDYENLKSYCEFPDRRFYQSKMKGLNPAGRSLKTHGQPTKLIPLGCYDSIDGIFDPFTLCVTNFEQPSKIIRIPSAKDCEWIMKNCRKGGTEPTGYKPWLNENWSENPPDLPYRLPMSNDSPEKWWDRIFTFEKDSNVILKEKRISALLENREGRSSARSANGSKTEGNSECPCATKVSQLELEEGYDVCENLDVCGDQNSEELSVADFNILRKVICEKIIYSDGEYEGEYVEDWSMTVCCPPEPTILRRRRRKSSKSLESESGKEKEIETEMENEEEEESLEESETEESGMESLEESFTFSWGEEQEEKYYLQDFLSDEILQEKFMKGEKGDNFEQLIESKKRVIKKRKSNRAKKTEKVKKTEKSKKVGIKKERKPPCPDLIDTEQLLQKKVGDLLFSPALDAPRSPVYLVKKDCDKNFCKKLPNAPKYDFSKCGVSLSPANSPVTKKRVKLCKEDKKLTEKFKSETKNICSSSKPFVTIRKKKYSQVNNNCDL